MRWVVLSVVVLACKGSGGNEAPPPPPTPAFPLVAISDAVTSLAMLEVPSAVVWISATGAIERAPAPKVWDGRLPSAARVPLANLDVLAAILPLASTEPITRGFERATAAGGRRDHDDPHMLVMASPQVPAATVVQLLVRTGGQLGVVQSGDKLGALRTWYQPAEVGYVANDERQLWIELHLDAAGIDVLALPSNGHTLVPWVNGTADAGALRAIYQTLGKEKQQLDVFVTPDVPYQRLIDTLVVLDRLGAWVSGVGESPGPIDGRLAEVLKLRNARASYSTATAVLELGQPTVQGDLDTSEIKRVIRGELAALTACYDAQLATSPGLQGLVPVIFFIAPTGKVVATSVVGVDPKVASCIAETLKKLAFPRPKGGGGVQVGYPLKFRPKNS